jgi:hypothetical protein
VELACRDNFATAGKYQDNTIYTQIARTLESSNLQSEVNSRNSPMIGDSFAEKLRFICQKNTDVTTYNKKIHQTMRIKKML